MMPVDPIDVLLSVGKALKERENKAAAEEAAALSRAKAAAAAKRAAERGSWTCLGGGWQAVPLVSALRHPSGRVTLVRRLQSLEGGSVVEVVEWQDAKERSALERGVRALSDAGRLVSARWEIRG